MRAFAEASGCKLGQVAQPLRAALTGRTTSPGLFDVMAVLGREETLARLAIRCRRLSAGRMAGELALTAWISPAELRLASRPAVTDPAATAVPFG